ncbi:MAG: glycosyl transferase [Cryobacterium sp.]|jgi:glycosyltransferase involved in cell wall biosynthesis|nr:glycosyl transferase [Cryobacterium sp.]
MKVLLWHVHGGWTDAFVRGPHEYLLPTTDDRGAWGLGRGGRDWPSNVQEVAPESMHDRDVDCVVLQRPDEILLATRLLGRSPGRDIPAVYVEHNTPRENVPNSVHPLAGRSDITLVHVTHFNRLFWDSGRAPTTVIEHGIVDPGPLYSGEIGHQAVVINEPVRRHRVTGTDLLPRFIAAGPVDVFGMAGSGLAGHLGHPAGIRHAGDLATAELHRELARRRVYLHPLRWTSLGLALLEAMHLAMPVVVLAATEASRAVPPGAGAISTDVDDLVAVSRRLLEDPDEAMRRGRVAREAALERYNLRTFLSRWDEVLGSARKTITPPGRQENGRAAPASVNERELR